MKPFEVRPSSRPRERVNPFPPTTGLPHFLVSLCNLFEWPGHILERSAHLSSLDWRSFTNYIELDYRRPGRFLTSATRVERADIGVERASLSKKPC